MVLGVDLGVAFGVAFDQQVLAVVDDAVDALQLALQFVCVLLSMWPAALPVRLSQVVRSLGLVH